MKNYKGGYQIISLKGLGNILDIVESEESVEITDKEILDSLKSIAIISLMGGKPKIPLLINVNDDDIFDGVFIGGLSFEGSGESTIKFDTGYSYCVISFGYQIDEETQELNISAFIYANASVISQQDVERIISDSLINGELNIALQRKTLSVNDFPLTSDFDTQHAVVNVGLLPDDDMSDLSESDVLKLRLTLSRIINKGWLCDGDSKAIKISGVEFTNTRIQITATSVFYDAGVEDIILSYLITLNNNSYTIKTYEL